MSYGSSVVTLADQLVESILTRSKQNIHRQFSGERYSDEVLSFEEISSRVESFLEVFLQKKEEIINILTRYETYEVANDEIERTLDLLLSLHENKSYFVKRVGAVTTFLPRNQPLYAFSCFAIVPSLMSKEVHVRPPLVMNYFFSDLISTLQIENFFNNIFTSYKARDEFLKERTKININLLTGEKIPETSVVIFTGTMENADKMRVQFSKKTLFIANGSGHNPIVITPMADLQKAIFSAMRVQLYNQGQDCANPNSILVHSDIYEEFFRLLRLRLSQVKVGDYKNPEARIGPISDRKDLARIQNILIENAQWLDSQTPGIIHTRTSIVEPTIILRPLKFGGNYTEQFSPLFFIQRYENDNELKIYFEDERYAPNAMYITVFGQSKYIDSLLKKPTQQRLHDESTIIRNTDLHAKGVERGVKPYGGYGRGASCVSLNGKIIAFPTLPQRDIYDYLISTNANSENGKVKAKKSHQDIASKKIRLKGHSLSRNFSKKWCTNIIQELLERFPHKRSYRIGIRGDIDSRKQLSNLRKIVSASLLKDGLSSKGKKCLTIFVWDDGQFDSQQRLEPRKQLINDLQSQMKLICVEFDLNMSFMRQSELQSDVQYKEMAQSSDKQYKCNNEIINFTEDQNINYKSIETERFEGVELGEDALISEGASAKSHLLCKNLDLSCYMDGYHLYLPDESEVCESITLKINTINVNLCHNNDDRLLPLKLIEVLEVGILKFCLLRANTNRDINLSIDNGIYGIYDYYDQQNALKRITFSQLVFLGQLSNWSFEKIMPMAQKLEIKTEIINDYIRMQKAKKWLSLYGDSARFNVLQEPNVKYFLSLSKTRQEKIKLFNQKLFESNTLDELNKLLYQVSKIGFEDKMPALIAQRDFFKDMYNLTIGKNSGPRLSNLIWCLGLKSVNDLLYF